MKNWMVFGLNYIMLLSCNTLPKSHKTDNVIIQFHGKPVDTQYWSKRALIFTSGFNDSLLIKQHNMVLAHDFFKTDVSQSYTGISLTVNMRRGTNIEVIDLGKRDILIVELLEGYEKIEIARIDNKWGLIYTNSPIVFE